MQPHTPGLVLGQGGRVLRQARDVPGWELGGLGNRRVMSQSMLLLAEFSAGTHTDDRPASEERPPYGRGR